MWPVLDECAIVHGSSRSYGGSRSCSSSRSDSGSRSNSVVKILGFKVLTAVQGVSQRFKVLTAVQGSHSGSRFSQWVKISQQLEGHATDLFVSDRGFSQRFSFRVCTTAKFLAVVQDSDRGLRGLPAAV